MTVVVYTGRWNANTKIVTGPFDGREQAVAWVEKIGLDRHAEHVQWRLYTVEEPE